VDLESAAGIALIVGFAMVVIASIIGPNEVYRAPDAETRLKIIAVNEGRWRATNLVWAFASLVTGAGMLMLTLALRESEDVWLFYLGALAFTIGAIAWVAYLVARIGDPAGNLYTSPPAPLSLVFAWATIVGLALYGLAFVLGSYPDGLGYLLLVPMGLLALGLIFAFDEFYASFPPQVFYLLTLLIGIVALRR
jgi:hypothetical protein